MENKVLRKLHDSEIKILDEFVKICENNNLKYFLVGGTLLGAARHSGFIPWDDDLDVGMPREDFEKFVNIYYKELNERFLFDYFTINKLYCYSFAKIRIKNSEFVEKKLKDYSGNNGIWIDIFPIDNANNLSKASQQKKKKNKLQIIMMVKCGEISGSTSKKIAKRLLSSIFSNKFLGNKMKKIMSKQNNEKNKYYINLGSQYSIEKQSHLINKYYPLKKLKFEEKEYNVPNDYDYVLKKIYGEKYMELPPKEKRVTHNPLKIVFEDGEEVIFDEEV